ncbi:MAG: class I SAM-dependent methyltransferase [Gemmatimonadetes bacterium]|nr:class I SAM-dependent methyltransferase [Gemmatimonadota bacterium]
MLENLAHQFRTRLLRNAKRAETTSSVGNQHFSHQGTCDICEDEVTFTAQHSYFRDHLICSGCGSIPRERALMRVIKQFFPNFAELRIHESSPVGRGVSKRLASECSSYSYSFLLEQVALGEVDTQSGRRCEDLERLTFDDDQFDLFVTQDVMEHVFVPNAAFREIGRVLKSGGAHIFTVPLVNGTKASERRANRTSSGEIEHHMDPVYHGDPTKPDGALVTMNWGFDLASSIINETG